MTTALFMKTNAASSSQSGSSLYRGGGGGVSLQLLRDRSHTGVLVTRFQLFNSQSGASRSVREEETPPD